MKNIHLLLLLFFNSFLSAQTVVKMNMPPQADEKLNVIALFDEEIPEEIPVIMDISGYNITGGIAPYSYEWILNGSVASTNNMVTFTPKKGDNLSLKINDNAGCRATTSFNLKVARLDRYSEKNGNNKEIKIYPTVIKDHINIELPGSVNEKAVVKIFNTNGTTITSKQITGSKNISITLNTGVYFISVEVGNNHLIQKIIAQ